MKNIVFLMCLITFSFASFAQQSKCLVKTIGRPNKPGKTLENVSIRIRGEITPLLSKSNGEAIIPAKNRKEGDPIVLLSVQKKDYELKDKGLIGRELPYSTQVPIEILMVSRAQLLADKRRIEDNARRVAEENYEKKKKEIEKQLKSHQITEQKCREQLASLENNYDKYLSLIEDMAERYARTDYDKLDPIDREINICIENGELDKADSLILTVFDPNTVLERNRAAKEEIQKRIVFAQQVIDKANADREAILRDMKYAERVVALSEILSAEYQAQGEKDKAIDCLEKSLKIQMQIYGKDSERIHAIRQKIEALKSK